MTRIPPLQPPYSEAIQRRFTALMPEGMPPLTLFRTLAHNPRVLRSLHKGGLLDAGSITLRQRELAILCTCALCDARYEWGVHAALFADMAKLSPKDIEATVRSSSADPRWASDERLVVRLCEELHAHSHPSDGLYAELTTCFNTAQILELTAIVGLYHSVSFLVNTSGVEPEPWAYPWPQTTEA